MTIYLWQVSGTHRKGARSHLYQGHTVIGATHNLEPFTISVEANNRRQAEGEARHQLICSGFEEINVTHCALMREEMPA